MGNENMSNRVDDVNDKTDKRSVRQRRHLWLVQLIEYAIGLGIAWSATRASEPLIPALLAAAVTANAALVKAPLSAFRVTNAQVHRFIGIALAVVAFALAIFIDVDATTKVLLILGAVAEGFVSVRFGHGI